MLVLSRKCGEEIVIGENITVKVLYLQGGRVKLGVSAPEHTPVHRAEVQDKLVPCPPTAAYA
jgi:carbon storage regulator